MGQPDRLICVLGMHRSGTSCLTGSLQDAGLFLGDCHTWNPFNRKGNRENAEFVELNDQILAANDGAWNKPPKKSAWLPEHEQRALDILERHKEAAALGFKDPRTLLVLEGWKRVYPEIEFIGIIRHPNAVAASLQNREGMPRSEALALWYKYNKLLYKECRRGPFPILCFDEDEEMFHQKLDKAVQRLDLGGENKDQRFYDDELRTSHRAENEPLPWKVQRLYHQLLKQCL
ncbi:MAG: sulfotransferase [Halioglobus sp.]